jgi:hypothetical protein
MPRNISFALTREQFLDGSKDVTRRGSWLFLKAGDVLMAVEQAQGLSKGQKVVRLGPIVVISARREMLDALTADPVYGASEVKREGFPQMTPAEFVAFFCRSHRGCTPGTVITRIEFNRLPEAA